MPLPNRALVLVVDGRNYLDPCAVRAAGLVYEGIGRPGHNGVRAGEPIRAGDASDQ